MFYTIYKITNNINGKYYIGKHQTKYLDDGYMGSGKLLKRAFKKYGLDNFSKEILHVFLTEQEMNDKEKELVILQEMCYNLCEGGKGGFGYINDNGLGITQKQKTSTASFNRTHRKTKFFEWWNSLSSEEMDKWKHKISLTKIGEKNPLGFLGKHHSYESKKKISQANKGRIPWNKGKAWKDWHPNGVKDS